MIGVTFECFSCCIILDGSILNRKQFLIPLPYKGRSTVGRHHGHAPPPTPVQWVFLAVYKKNVKIMVGAPLGKSWIRHCGVDLMSYLAVIGSGFTGYMYSNCAQSACGEKSHVQRQILVNAETVSNRSAPAKAVSVGQGC